ncbi:hypothetical protein I7I48_01098 [Histoplasma ohiense]|nr:hypothetical protein I7I48_01098 [Histoplasma ohiense (nom. inval.)]
MFFILRVDLSSFFSCSLTFNFSVLVIPRYSHSSISHRTPVYQIRYCFRVPLRGRPCLLWMLLFLNVCQNISTLLSLALFSTSPPQPLLNEPRRETGLLFISISEVHLYLPVAASVSLFHLSLSFAVSADCVSVLSCLLFVVISLPLYGRLQLRGWVGCLLKIMPSSILKCTICPKKPNFSDVSHLLTHISSKGHLSHYFKLQVRSHQEPEAGESLAVYDQWYKEHNLAGLLSERMLTKEAKKSNSDFAAVERVSSFGRNSRVKESRSAAKPPKQPARTSHLPDYLDPRMSLPYIATDNSHTVTQEAPRISSATNNTSKQSPAPRAPLWLICQSRMLLPSGAENAIGWKPVSNSSTSEEMSPVSQGKKSLVEQVDNPHTASLRRPRHPVTPDPFLDNDSLEYVADDDDGESPTGREEATRLKGILWPGMDIFDSATEQMRKKRNQKKDVSILKQMEKTSENVEATELVFSPGGTLRRERPISGEVDDTSPLTGESPIPKRIPRPRRRPLASSSTNLFNLRGQRRKPTKADRRRHTDSLAELSRQALPLLDCSPTEYPLQYFANQYVEGDEACKLTFTDYERKPRRGFTIFNDSKEGVQAAFREAISRGEDSPTNAMKVGRNAKPSLGTFVGSRSLFRPSGASSSYKFQSSRSYTQTRPTALLEYTVGKENIEPLMNSDGRVDSHGGHVNWPEQQAVEKGQYSTHYFYGSGAQQSFGAFAENDAFGYSCNPLSFSYLQTQPCDGLSVATLRSHDTIAAHEKAKESCAASPDGTVSDVDREEYRNIYLDNPSQ